MWEFVSVFHPPHLTPYLPQTDRRVEMFQRKPNPIITHQITATSTLHLCNDDARQITNDTHHNRARASKEEIKKKLQMVRQNIRVFNKLRSTEYKPMLLNLNHTQ